MAGANVSLGRGCVGGRDDHFSKGTCSVCGEMPSGIYYGAVSCQACRKFFAKKVNSKIEYKCSDGNQCKISMKTRKFCTACRFNKCLRMGMIKESVRLYKVRDRRESPLLRSLSDLVGSEVRVTVEWAKQVPGFTQLSLLDQMRLIKTCWAEILSLDLAYRSMPRSSGHLSFASNFLLGERHGKALHAEELFSQCFQVVERLDILQISYDEYLILKALVLVNSDVYLEDGAAVMKMRELQLVRLHDRVNADRLNPLQHVSNLLLCLPLLRQVDASVRRFWTNVRRERRVAMNEFLVELLKKI